MNIYLVYKEKAIHTIRLPFLFDKRMLRALILMKAIVLLVLFSVQVSANVSAQNINLTLRNAPLSVVLEQISKQTEYDFSYNDNVLKKAKPVNVTLRNETLEKSL